MPRKSTVHAVTAIGIDMGKNTLHMVGLDSRGPSCCGRKSRAGALQRAFRTCRRRALLVSKQEWRHTMLLASLLRLATM